MHTSLQIFAQNQMRPKKFDYFVSSIKYSKTRLYQTGGHQRMEKDSGNWA